MDARRNTALYLVVYYSYIQTGELVLEPASEILSTTVELDLWLFDRYTDTLKNESTFKARIYCLDTGKPVFVKSVVYP